MRYVKLLMMRKPMTEMATHASVSFRTVLPGVRRDTNAASGNTSASK